jgi:hypothetical protein
VAVVALALVPGAHAAGVIQQAAAALADDPVYVAPDAEEQVDAQRVRDEIASSRSGPVYIAILPASAADEAGGDPTEVVRQLHAQLGRDGTYAAVVGNHFRALSNTLGQGEAGRLATEAIDAHGNEGVTPTLVDFVDRVAAARKGGDGTPSGSGWILPVLLVGGLAIFLVARGRSRKRQAAADLAAVREVAHDDLIALAGDVQRLETEVEAKPEAKAAYDKAIQSYGDASDAFDRARTAKELSKVSRALEEGRYEMAVAEAALAGKPAPARREPCFFDPRHGPSVRDVLWAPPGGSARKVPACEADAERVERGEEPATRQIAYGGAMIPYYAAPPVFGGYYGGFLPGFLTGQLLGGPFGWSGGWYTGGGSSFGGSTGGGDFGSFGGGDLGGGGDFGGGGGDF